MINDQAARNAPEAIERGDEECGDRGANRWNIHRAVA
jgi:hypothetical protein